MESAIQSQTILGISSARTLTTGMAGVVSEEELSLHLPIPDEPSAAVWNPGHFALRSLSSISHRQWSIERYSQVFPSPLVPLQHSLIKLYPDRLTPASHHLRRLLQQVVTLNHERIDSLRPQEVE
jgi:hypothetical protein